MQQEDYYHYDDFMSESTVPFEDYTLEEYISSVSKEMTITTPEQLMFRTGVTFDYQFEPGVLEQLKKNKEDYNALRVSRIKELNNKK